MWGSPKHLQNAERCSVFVCNNNDNIKIQDPKSIALGGKKIQSCLFWFNFFSLLHTVFNSSISRIMDFLYGTFNRANCASFRRPYKIVSAQ